MFSDIDAWYVELKSDGSETFTLDTGTGKLDVPDSIDGLIRVLYQYLIGSGDFTIDIDITDYQKDAAGGPVVQFMTDSAASGLGSNYMYIRTYDNAGTWRIRSFWRINGSSGSSSYVNIAGQPTKLRIVRDGTNLKTYYYISSWVLIDNVAFGAYASEVDMVKLSLADLSLHGGHIKWDNLTFLDGCPSGYPKAWTTTTSTTSTCTTTSTPPP